MAALGFVSKKMAGSVQEEQMRVETLALKFELIVGELG